MHGHIIPVLYTGYKQFGYKPFFLDENMVRHFSFQINEKTGILQLKNSWLNPVEPAKYHLPDVKLIHRENTALECVRVFSVKVLEPNRKLKKLVRTNAEQIQFAIPYNFGGK